MKFLDFCMKNKKNNFIRRLLDMDDREVSSTNLYLFAITGIGFILLLVPAIILLIEAFYNHTILTSLDGMASYITAVSALFATAGITKAWTSWTYSKYPVKNCCPDEGEVVNEEDHDNPQEP